MTAAEFMKAFPNGVRMVTQDEDDAIPSRSFLVQEVTTIADGSLRVVAKGARTYRISHMEQGKDQWMAQIDNVGRVALRPLSKALAAQL